MRRLILPALAGILLAATVSAQEPDAPPAVRPDYRVELLIFEYVEPDAGDEDWSAPPPPPPAPDGGDATAPDEPVESIEKAPLRFERLADEDHTLGEIVDRMRRSRDYRPLVHTGWVQPGYTAEEAPSLPLARVAALPERLGGSATLYLARYLHLTLDLELVAPAGTPIVMDGGLAPLGERPIYRLQERRRMRSGELHFFDNPRFGALVRISPIPAPG